MTWAIREKNYSQRRACQLVGLHSKTCRYASRELALKVFGVSCRTSPPSGDGSTTSVSGYCWLANHKKLYHCYKKKRLSLKHRGRKRTVDSPAPMAFQQDRNLRGSLDFIMDTLVSGWRFGILIVVDDFSRACLGWWGTLC